MKQSGSSDAVAVKIGDDLRLLVRYNDGTEEWLRDFDCIVLGLGSRKYDPISEQLRSFVPEVFVIGDAVKPGQSSDAMHQGFEVAYRL